MMSTTQVADVEYIDGASLPAAAFEWTDADGTIIDFSTGYTFELWIDNAPFKNSGIVGQAESPNILIIWALNELNVLAFGFHWCVIDALETVSGLHRMMKFSLERVPKN